MNFVHMHDSEIPVPKKTDQRLSVFCNRSEGLSRLKEVCEKEGAQPSEVEELSTTAISKTMISGSTEEV